MDWKEMTHHFCCKFTEILSLIDRIEMIERVWSIIAWSAIIKSKDLKRGSKQTPQSNKNEKGLDVY